MAEKKKFEYDDFQYDDFTYGDYQESDIVKNAQTALNAHLATKPGAYQSQWQNQLNGVLDKIMNREEFTYDLNGDALYQQYKDKVTQQGKMAMADAIGQASAMTGGRGNSYAQSVGQQMYQKELQNLNDMVPELYQLALAKHDMDTQNLHKQHAVLSDMEDRDYGRYRDTVSDWTSERGYLADRYDAERSLDYSKYTDGRDFAYGQYNNDRSHAYGVYSDNKNLAYTDYRNAIEDAQKAEEFEYQKAQDLLARDLQERMFAHQQAQDKIANEQWRLTHDAEMAKNAVELGLAGAPYVPDKGNDPVDSPKEPKEEPKEEKVDIDSDLNHLIKEGAKKSEVKAYLREALKAGVISDAEYQAYIKKYAPVGYTY